MTSIPGEHRPARRDRGSRTASYPPLHRSRPRTRAAPSSTAPSVAAHTTTRRAPVTLAGRLFLRRHAPTSSIRRDPPQRVCVGSRRQTRRRSSQLPGLPQKALPMRVNSPFAPSSGSADREPGLREQVWTASDSHPLPVPPWSRARASLSRAHCGDHTNTACRRPLRPGSRRDRCQS